MESTENTGEKSAHPDSAASSTREDSTDIDDRELELLKEQYLSLRDETQLRIESLSKRITQGLTAIGAIAGYGLLSDNIGIISITPIVLGVLYIESARVYSQIGRLAGHMYHIEEKLQEIAPLFRWETEHGGLYGVSESILDITKYRIPTYLMVVVAVGAYVILLSFSMLFWPSKFETGLFSSEVLGVIYLLYGLVIAVAWIAAHQSITEESALPD